jgi:hypothetical protein
MRFLRKYAYAVWLVLILVGSILFAACGDASSGGSSVREDSRFSYVAEDVYAGYIEIGGVPCVVALTNWDNSVAIDCNFGD